MTDSNSPALLSIHSIMDPEANAPIENLGPIPAAKGKAGVSSKLTG